MDLSKFSDETWDRFFDFIADGHERLTPEEVSRELVEAGIDVTEAKRRLWEMIDKVKEEK